jgi:branched-chain amino acid transport system substrate-binding protein
LSILVVLIGAFALLAAGCGGDDEAGGTGGATTGGGGEAKTVKIVSDLPLQGSSAAQTEQMNNAIKLYLSDIGNKVGNYTIQFEAFDDSTAAKGAWDEATCAANARKYVEDETIIGVIGTFNSGCAKIEVPIANEASLAYISPANTAVGLTHVGPGSESGEPEKYYPTGTRNYARVVTSDDVQGQIDAAYMKDKLGVTKVFILDDKDAYGKGVADAFEAAAKDIGLAVAGHEGWDANAQNYKALMTSVKSSGADRRLGRLRSGVVVRRGRCRERRRHVRQRSDAEPGRSSGRRQGVQRQGGRAVRQAGGLYGICRGGSANDARSAREVRRHA